MLILSPRIILKEHPLLLVMHLDSWKASFRGLCMPYKEILALVKDNAKGSAIIILSSAKRLNT